MTKNDKVSKSKIWIYLLVGLLIVVSLPVIYTCFWLFVIALEIIFSVIISCLFLLLIMVAPTLLLGPFIYTLYRIVKTTLNKRYQALTLHQPYKNA